MPPSDGDAARTVVADLGLARAQGAPWDDLVRHAPNRSLPRFAWPEDGGGRPEDDATPFVRAHHLAAFYWVLLDRVADGQAPRTKALVRVRRSLLGAWASALSDALDDAAAARRAIAGDLWRWRRGVALDRAVHARGWMTPSEYRESVRLRLRCVSTCAGAMLVARGRRGVAAALLRVSDLFLLACQCRDDALDVAEDRASRGASVPELLGVVPGALLRAGARLATRARDEAARAGFGRYARWLEGFAREANVGAAGGDDAAQVFGALALIDGMRLTNGGTT